MRIFMVICGLCFLCSCEESESNNQYLSNAQVGSVAQQISSLLESAVQNSIAEEGEIVVSPPVMAQAIASPLNGLGLCVPGYYGSPRPALNSFSFDEEDIDFTEAESFDTNVFLNGSAYPNATGIINVNATASPPTGDISSGSITFNPIVVTTLSNVQVTDPYSDAMASWPNGTVFNYTVTVTWTRTDEDNWSYTTTTTSVASNRSVTVTGFGETYVGNIDHNFNWSRTVSRSGGGAVAIALNTFNGTREANWTEQSNGRTHSVVWNITSLSDIEVVVDGFSFQFNSILAMVTLLNASLEHDSEF